MRARLLRHRTHASGHGHQRHVGVAQLPVADHRLLRPRVRAADDHELGLACIRAWNDWLFEEWYSPYPERIIPLGITYPQPTRHWPSAEIRAQRRARLPSVTLPERPHRDRPAVAVRPRPLGARSSRPASETDTVICLHVGISGGYDRPARRAALQLGATLFGQLSLGRVRRVALVGLRCRRPRPEDRHVRGRHRLGGHAARPARQHRRPLRLRPRRGTSAPADVLRRNFWFCTHRRSVDDRHPPPRSASRTSWSRPTTRTATARGPTRRP